MASKWLLAVEAAFAAGSLSETRANSAVSAKRSGGPDGPGAIGTKDTIGTLLGERHAPAHRKKDEGQTAFLGANSALTAESLKDRNPAAAGAADALLPPADLHAAQAAAGSSVSLWYAPEAEREALARETGLSADQLDRDWPASAWRRLYAARRDYWRAPRRDTRDSVVTRFENPDRLAFSDIANKWRVKHWRKPSPGVCAGCGGQLGDGPSLDLGGYAVHQGREPDCLILHSRQWRTEAMAALVGFGIKPALEWGP